MAKLLRGVIFVGKIGWGGDNKMLFILVLREDTQCLHVNQNYEMGS